MTLDYPFAFYKSYVKKPPFKEWLTKFMAIYKKEHKPHAVPSALGTVAPMSSLGYHGSTPGLKRASQNLADPNPAFRAESTFHQLAAPTRVTSPRYLAQLMGTWMNEGHNVVILFLCFRCGISFSLFRESIMLDSHFTSNHK
ncbi:hypothetical protein NC651_015314 [Populus alba x Populus x berolinensis]|nr:hypothetical protein NC651_015314 [Populus alba x Populus x berolinensis]